MATPIKITPALSGKQSKEFNIKIAKSSKVRAPKEEKDRILSIVEKVLSRKSSKS
ncbi:MAG: hypothetical protein H6598_10280 [Flavobacteriales bacterium]|nr:hypothetical protein [Flavobacteriales bacterium]